MLRFLALSLYNLFILLEICFCKFSWFLDLFDYWLWFWFDFNRCLYVGTFRCICELFDLLPLLLSLSSQLMKLLLFFLLLKLLSLLVLLHLILELFEVPTVSDEDGVWVYLLSSHRVSLFHRVESQILLCSHS